MKTIEITGTSAADEIIKANALNDLAKLPTDQLKWLSDINKQHPKAISKLKENAKTLLRFL